MKPDFLLATVLLGFVVLASGCLSQQAEPTNPVLVDSQQKQGVLDRIQGEAVIEADIKNTGSSGNVRIFADILGENDVVLATENKTVYIEENETRRIQMRFEVPEGALGYRLDVEAVEQQ